MLGHIEILKSIYDSINFYRNTFPEDNRQILDPLTTMIKLALLGYKPVGTKLAIDNNKIYFQEPFYLQGVFRWAYGYKKYELHHLLNPIIKAVKRYSVSNPSIKFIFQSAILGLDRLKETYNNSSSVTVHSLDLYTSIINNVLMSEVGNEVVSGNVSSKGRINSNSIFHNINEDDEINTKCSVFQNLWSDDEINLVAKMLQQSESTKKEEKKTYLDAVNTILIMKEDRANELIAQVTSHL